AGGGVEARMSERSEFAGRPPPVREAQVTDRRSRSGERFGLCFLLVTLISHSAAEERFFAQAKKSDSPKPRSGWRKLLLRGSAGACFCPWLQLQSRTREQTRAEGKARQSKAKQGKARQSQDQNLFRPRRCAATASYFFLAPAKSWLGTLPRPPTPPPGIEGSKEKAKPWLR